jgi:hypothetical protein
VLSTLSRALAAGLTLALLPFGGFDLVVSTPASAAGTGLYAFAGGAAAAPASCPDDTATAADQCTLAQALSLAGPGDTVYLATAGTSGPYVGNWTITTTGTSASAPLTIEPANGVTNPALDGNGGNASGCPTTSVGCSGPVLTIGDVYVDVIGVTFQNADNTSTGYGGAIANNEAGTVTVSNSTFSANQTALDGGAIDNGDGGGTGTLSVANSIFSDNTAPGSGGAIDSADNNGSAALTVTASTFSSNSALFFDGGAIDSGDRSGQGTLSVSGSTFSDNSAGENGGAIGNGLALFGPGSSGTATLVQDTFTDNTAAYNGGAVGNGDDNGTGALTVTNSQFSSNVATMANGGAIDSGDYSGNGALTATSSTFVGNTAGGDGGAIDTGDAGGMATLTATSSTFSTNSAASDGGAIDNGDNTGSGTATIVASTFAANALTNTSNATVTHDGPTLDNGDNTGSGTLAVAADILDGSCNNGADGTWSDGGYNASTDTSCLSPGPVATDNDGAGLSNLLGPLETNGGPTETIVPLPGDPAIGIVPDPTTATVEGGSFTLCPTTDQRGAASGPGQACDAGSVQMALPVAQAQTYSAVMGTELSQPSGTLQTGVSDDNAGVASWTAQLSNGPTDGTAEVSPDGSFTYLPHDGFNGTDSFTYTLTDNLGYTSAPATVTVTVSPAPAAPPASASTSSSPPAATASTTTSPAARPATEPFPGADRSYPNGAIVSFGRNDYVFAGGRAFSATARQLRAVEKVDHARVLAAVTPAHLPTTLAPRSGTLLSTRAVNGQPTIYVVGTDGELHGFSTWAQFVRDGYDAALVVTTPNLGGLGHGLAAGVAGPAVNALATRADGGIVDAAGAFYVFAAGKADGISTPGELVRIRKADAATVVHGPVGSAETRVAIASGVLFSAGAKVYVSYEGDLYPFETRAQLATDGYGGTAAVPVAGTGALTVVPPASKL